MTLTRGRSRSARHQSAILWTLMLITAIVVLAVTAWVQPVTAGSVRFSLSWTDDTPDDHDGFKIERRLGTSGIETYIEVSQVGDVRDYLDTEPSLLPDTVYCYRVRAYNAVGDSDYSNEACAARYTLTVTKSGTGVGTVTSIPAAIDCGSTCTSPPLSSSTQLILTAAASPGSRFVGWGGDCATFVTARCTVTMNQTRNVIATFALDATAHSLTVVIGGSSGGSVGSNPSGITCPPACMASFTGGAPITLAESADMGGTFRLWRGNCTGTSATCSVYIDGEKAATAVFSKTFADATLTPQVTPVKVVHITDLRAAINMLRSRYGLGVYPWTDPTLTPGITSIKSAHLTDLRTALNAAYVAAGRPSPTYAESITATQPVIRASHLNELRTLVRGLE